MSAGGDGSGRQAALESLCQCYWTPLYAFVRRRVGSAEAAQDLTQEFFLRLVEKGTVAAAMPERGRFRAYLLASVKNFLAHERERARAAKRGGGRPALSLDWAGAESRMKLEPADDVTAERLYEREWATTLLERCLGRLGEEFVAAGKGAEFEALKGTLAGGEAARPYAKIAAELGCSPEAARQAAHRLRRRYREVLRAEVAETVADPRDVDEEIRGLFAIMGG